LDNTAWHFETDGVGSFGELRSADRRGHGTEVRLTLRPEVAANWTEWYRKLRDYLTYTLIYCPCEFRLGSSLPECGPLERGGVAGAGSGQGACWAQERCESKPAVWGASLERRSRPVVCSRPGA
jgi:hypothetical protein